MTWEEQLLMSSLDLKHQLKDPHFVAKRCDLDSSGDLDMHEFSHAARSFGMKFAPARLQQLMAGESRISKERFAEIVAEQVEQGLEAEKARPIMPHSLRGMALGQLQHLETLFVNCGWLSGQCDKYNAKNADAIREARRGFFHQAPNLYAMDLYVVTPMSKPGFCTARGQDAEGSVPEASEEISFSELLNPRGLTVHCFVSRFWGHLFSQTVTSLQLWAERNQQHQCGARSMV